MRLTAFCKLKDGISGFTNNLIEQIATTAIVTIRHFFDGRKTET